MIDAAVGVSTEPRTLRAALEAARRAAVSLPGGRADWCLAFVSADHRPHLEASIQTLCGVLDTPYVVGCSAAGLIGPERELDRGPFIGLLAVRSPELRATPFLFHDEGDFGVSAGVRLGQRFSASRDSNDLLLVLPDPFHVRPDRLLGGLDAVLGEMPVVGGAPSSAPAPTDTFEFCGDEVGTAAVSGLRLGGSCRHVVGVTHGCRAVGSPLRVTRSHQNLLLELDGEPAFDKLRAVAPPGLLEELDWALNFLFVGVLATPSAARPPQPDFLVRNIVSADPDTGVVAIADQVEEGEYVVFAHREADTARRDLSRCLERLTAPGNPVDYRFGLYFNCVARGRALYREASVDRRLLSRFLPGLPLLGMASNAEIGPLSGENRLLTYSGVLLLVGEEKNSC